MAISPKTVESLENKGSDPETKDPKTAPKGPPPASPKPRSASDSSLYSSAGKEGMNSSMNGMGAEGNSPSLVGMQGLALVQRGLQMLNLAFPDNPGLVAILADLTGRLQTLIPQLVAQSSNGAGMGMGMMGQAMGQQPMPGMQPGMPGPGMGAPMAGGMPPAPMPPGGAPPMGGAPMGPPRPPLQ